MLAEMFGSFIMFALGSFVSLPKYARSSGARLKAARMRAAREISLVSISMPAAPAKDFAMGKRLSVARRGDSSVRV